MATVAIKIDQTRREIAVIAQDKHKALLRQAAAASLKGDIVHEMRYRLAATRVLKWMQNLA